MEENTKEEQEQILLSFKNSMSDICILQDDILSISEESIDKISSDLVDKFHFFTTKETAHDILLLIFSFIQIRPLKIPLYGQLLFKLSKYFAPLTTEEELMDLFSSKKLIILYLLEAKLISIDTILKNQQFHKQNIFYFCNEIRQNNPIYFGDLIITNEELEDFVLSISPEDHDKKRRLGLNDGEIETLIREDKQCDVHPNKLVHNSLYENSYFLSNTTYAEYASYFGSINVLNKFLEFNDIKTDRLLEFAIAGNQVETFRFLLDKKIKITHDCIRTSIKFYIKDIEINAYINNDMKIETYDNCSVSINGNQIKSAQNEMKKFMDINDLFLSLKTMNWNYFINNLLDASDQINNPCDDNDEEFTLFHCACLMGYKGVVNLLLSLFDNKNNKIMDVNIQDKNKRTPLHLAVSNQKVGVVKILFQCDDIDFQIQDNKGKTAFHYSAETKNKEIIQLFVDSSPKNKIDMNIPDNKGNTAFHYFCKPRYFEPSILKYICDCVQVDPNQLNHKKVTEVMHSIIKKKRIQILQVLADSERVDLNFQTTGRMETALMIATQNNDLESVKILMKYTDRIDPNLQDYKLRTALHIAVHYCSTGVLEFLIRQQNVDMNILDDFELTPVFSTLYKHHFKYFDSMLISYKERKMNLDYEKYEENNINFEHRDHFSQNLLHYAIRCQYMSCLDEILKIYSINEPDSKGTNSFHQACSLGCIDIVKYLIDQLGTTTDEEENNCIGLYNSSNDTNGVSPFELEEKKIIDDSKIARYKPGEKIRINQKDSNGLTPFHYACQCNCIELVNCLISIPGIKIDEKDNKGETPFFYACKCGFFETAKILFKTNQIDTYSTNLKGISAVSYLLEEDQKNLSM